MELCLYMTQPKYKTVHIQKIEQSLVSIGGNLCFLSRFSSTGVCSNIMDNYFVLFNVERGRNILTPPFALRRADKHEFHPMGTTQSMKMVLTNLA